MYRCVMRRMTSRLVSRIVRGLIVVGWLMGSIVAQAQPTTPQPASDAPDGPSDDAPDNASDEPADDASSQPTGSAADPRDDPAWTLYHDAHAAAADGRLRDAHALLSRLVREHRAHPAARRATALLVVLASTAPLGPGSTAAPPGDEPEDAALGPLSPEEPSKGARAELALFQLFHGMAIGGELCTVMDCADSGDGGLAAALVLLGGAGGLTLSLGYGRDRVTPGIRGLLNSGTSWGVYNGALLLAAIEPDGDNAAAGIMLLSQAAGFTAGAILASRRPTEGQVALANTFGIWSGALTFLALNSLEVDLDDAEASVTLIAGADLGLVIGGTIARHYRGSRGYTLLIDAGGIVGGLGGLAVASIIEEAPSDRLASTSALVGASLGLGVAAYLARRWEGDAWGSARLTLMPTRTPTGAAFGAGLAFEL